MARPARITTKDQIFIAGKAAYEASGLKHSDIAILRHLQNEANVLAGAVPEKPGPAVLEWRQRYPDKWAGQRRCRPSG
jgi:hypothetical protein